MAVRMTVSMLPQEIQKPKKGASLLASNVTEETTETAMGVTVNVEVTDEQECPHCHKRIRTVRSYRTAGEEMIG